MSQLKICGVTIEDDLKACLQMGVDFIGLNFSPSSKRFVAPSSHAELLELVRCGFRGDTRIGGVFVDQGFDFIKDSCDSLGLDFVQLHGRESPEEASAVRNALPNVKIWKAIGIDSKQSLGCLRDFKDSTDLILLDYKAPRSGESGGIGKAFPWEWLSDVADLGSLGIAGGVNLNTIQALRDLKPSLVDVCSGSELSPGVKDVTLIKQLLEVVREW